MQGRNKLIKAIEDIILIKEYDWEQISLRSQLYLEVLVTSNPDEIKEMINYVYTHHYMECPFWAKLIAFKILLCQIPDDQEVKAWALADAEMFGGPEWGSIISKW